MFNLSDLLLKHRARVDATQKINEIVPEVISEITGIKLTPDQIKIKGQVIYLDLDATSKSAAYFYSEQILNAIKSKNKSFSGIKKII